MIQFTGSHKKRINSWGSFHDITCLHLILNDNSFTVAKKTDNFWRSIFCSYYKLKMNLFKRTILNKTSVFSSVDQGIGDIGRIRTHNLRVHLYLFPTMYTLLILVLQNVKIYVLQKTLYIFWKCMYCIKSMIMYLKYIRP